ncbi:MAG: hypothetical protein JXM79_10900 [Sedimentisphaerales bacterium]|nr:hypothetical protein [Sedimentisphaerales bacterium]
MKAAMKNITTKRLISNVRLLICLVIVLPVGAGVWFWKGRQPRRVQRDHAPTITGEFEYLTKRFDFLPSYNPWISKTRAQEDLDELEWLLENRYSYLQFKAVDYKAALDSLSSCLGDGIHRSLFGYQLSQFIPLFGDGHSRIASSSCRLQSLCTGFPPFLVGESNGRLVAFKTDRSDFIDSNTPFLRAIDGVSLDSWLQVAGQFVEKGSPQYIRHHTIRNLRYIDCLRKELGLTETTTVEVELESTDGSFTKCIELPLVKEKPVYGIWPRPEVEFTSWEAIRPESRIFPSNIAYLRLIMMPAEPEFLDDLIEAMSRFRATDGLIIDLRTNGGGRRAPLQVLLPFFMAQSDPPRVVNVAAYRLGTENIKEDFGARYLYLASSSRWSKAEREVIGRFAETFKPDWTPPKGQFSPWHYFVISPSKDKRYYHYDKPVVILMDRGNFSACDIFLGAFKGVKNITLMGRPSGGGSGCAQEYRLAHSGIRVCLSRMASFQPNGQLYDGNGIQPDIRVEPAPTDFIGQSDTLLETAIRAIGEKNNSLHLHP